MKNTLEIQTGRWAQRLRLGAKLNQNQPPENALQFENSTEYIQFEESEEYLEFELIEQD